MIIDSHYHFWKNSALVRMDRAVYVCDSKRFSSNRSRIFFKQNGVDAKNLWLKSK